MEPYGPIDTGDVIVPTTGDFVVEVMGSRTVQYYQNQYLNNDAFANSGISDVWTTAANNYNNDATYDVSIMTRSIVTVMTPHEGESAN